MIRNFTITFLLLTLLYITVVYGKQSGSIQNHDLLHKVGLQRIRGPNSHHRKRLAVESRHHSRSDDSHMFIIKLPPNPHFYAHNLPQKDQFLGKNIPVGFKSNGKPAKVYHWNIPVIKKLAHSSKHKLRRNNMIENEFNDFQDPENWNEVLEKQHNERKPLKPSYYIPAKHKKSNVMKYFAGNGKPHSFYVIEKSKKAHYHRLLP